MAGQRGNTVCVGKISGVFGVKGWLKIFSYTSPRENILNYSPWLLKKADQIKSVKIAGGNLQGKSIVVQFADVNDRDLAATFIGWDVFVKREQLPTASEGEYYWSDLIGLRVVNLDRVDLGSIDGLLETGANDVLIVKGERDRAIPFVQGQTIIKIDRDAGLIEVDWDPGF